MGRNGIATMVKPRENRVPIMLSDEELEAIDDWQHENRIATRSEAIRRLCKLAHPLKSTVPRMMRQASRADVSSRILFETVLRSAEDSQKGNPVDFDQIVRKSGDVLDVVNEFFFYMLREHNRVESLVGRRRIQDAFREADQSDMELGRIIELLPKQETDSAAMRRIWENLDDAKRSELAAEKSPVRRATLWSKLMSDEFRAAQAQQDEEDQQ